MDLISKLLDKDIVPSKKKVEKPDFTKYKDENGNKFYEFYYSYCTGDYKSGGTFCSDGYSVMKKPIKRNLYLIDRGDAQFLVGLDLKRMLVDCDYEEAVSKLIVKKAPRFYKLYIDPDKIYLGNIVKNENGFLLKSDAETLKIAEPFIKIIAEERFEKLSKKEIKEIDDLKKKLESLIEKRDELNREIANLNSKYEESKTELFDKYGIDYEQLPSKKIDWMEQTFNKK